MKSKLILVAIIAAVSLLLVACASPSSVEVSYDDFIELPPGERDISKEVEVAVDNSFTVTLSSSPTTGFEWESAQISDQSVLQEVAHKFVPPEAKNVEGAAGKEVWTFKALKKGTSTISIDYSRPWEGGEKGAWTFNLTVVVK